MTRFWGVEESEKKNKPSFFTAFTLAEMMVVMLILSIVLAAMAPVMTTRNKPNNSSPWKYQANNRNNAWFGAGSAQHAMIGQNSYGANDTIAKLLISVGDNTTNFLAFKQSNWGNIGRLYMGRDHSLLLGATNSSVGSGALALGYANASGQNSIAIATTRRGYITNATGDYSIVIGSSDYQKEEDNSLASGQEAIAIGRGARGIGDNSIAIGGSNTFDNIEALESRSIAIGTEVKARSSDSIAIGSQASTGSSLESDPESASNIAIGNGVFSLGQNSVAIGSQARSRKDNTITLGYNVDAWRPLGIFIGNNVSSILANDDANKQIAIGNNVSNRASNSVAIGNDFSISSAGTDVVAIGSGLDNTFYSRAILIGNSNIAHRESDVIIGNNNVGSVSVGVNNSSQLGITFGVGNNATYAFGKNNSGQGIKIGENNSGRGIKIGKDNSGGSCIAIGDENSCGEGDYAGGDVAIGYNASALGMHSIAIGSSANAGYHYSTAIGAGATTTSQNQVVLGRPSDTVYIPGNLIVGNKSFFGANISGNDLGVAGHWGNGGVRAWIGDLSGDKHFDIYDGKGTAGRANDGYTGAYNYITFKETTSDRRLKYVGKENTSGLDKIRQLKVFNYTFKKDTTKNPHVGVIAQDLQKVFPNAVKKGADGFLTIRMEDMFYAVINAIKELDAKNQAQEKRITAIEKENKELKARLDRLEAKVK